MNREIKFRGKSKQGKWVYGSLIIAKHNGNPISFIYTPQYDITELHECSTDGDVKVLLESQVVPVLTDTVGQDTGLKDKNGKEIYEGDVVGWRYLNLWQRNEVEWVRGGFVSIMTAFKDDLNEMQSLSLISRLDCEVIGNIYEHPELLKETSQ